jgi:uncharacterized protein YciI
MAYAVITFDKPNTTAVRDRFRADHITYLEGFKEKLIASGGLMTEDEVVYGGCIIIDTHDRSVVEDFAANDPFTKADLFETIIIAKMRKGFFNFKRWT